jgi:hypothetical protein
MATAGVPVVAEQVEFRREARRGGRQYQLEFLRPAASQHAIVGGSRGRQLAEERRHGAGRNLRRVDAVEHRVEAPPRRRHQRQTVAELARIKLALRVLERCCVIEDGEVAKHPAISSPT